MDFDQKSNSLTKEEWVEDVETPCKIEEDEEKKAEAVAHDAPKGGAVGDITDNTIYGISKTEVKVEQVVEPEGPIPLQKNEPDPSGKETLYFCHVCDFVTVSSDVLVSHVERHQNEFVDPGENCNENNRKKARVQISPEELFSCGLCDYLTRFRKDLQNHLLVHANRLCPAKKSIADPRFLGLKCRQCDYTATTENDLITHAEFHKPHSAARKPSKVRCSHCDFKCGIEETLKLHFEQKHQTACKYCNHRTATRRQLNKHMVAFHKALPARVLSLAKSSGFSQRDNSKPYSCDLCGHRACSLETVANHMNRCHNVDRQRAILQVSKPLLLTGNCLLD